MAKVAEKPSKEQSYKEFVARCKLYKNIKRVNNEGLPAGSPMYFYCISCGEEMKVPEGYTHRSKYCPFCRSMEVEDWLDDFQARQKAEKLVLEEFAGFTKAWNRGDIEEACASYADDAIYTSPSAGLIRGRDKIVAYYKKSYGVSGAGKLRFKILSLHAAPDEKGDPVMVSVRLQWFLKEPKQKMKTGYSLLVYQEGEHYDLEVIEDAS